MKGRLKRGGVESVFPEKFVKMGFEFPEKFVRSPKIYIVVVDYPFIIYRYIVVVDYVRGCIPNITLSL